jgi:transcriptional regulator with XRE-family HTH domain
VTGDWAAVAGAVNQQLTELDMSQRELVERSRVSKAIVGEIKNNTVQRRRGARTLEALSLALALHPDHLSAVLDGDILPDLGKPVAIDLPTRLAAIERQLRHIARRLDSVTTRMEKTIGEHVNDQ